MGNREERESVRDQLEKEGGTTNERGGERKKRNWKGRERKRDG